jgi:hypothetical protein
MHPFVIFAIILIVIWTLSGIATWVNKQQEAERRRRAAMEFSRNPVPPPIVMVDEQRQISEGIAARYPQVLQPPMPMPPPRIVVRTPPPVRPMPPPQRAPALPKRAMAQRAQLTQKQLRIRQAQEAAARQAAAEEAEEYARAAIPMAQPAPPVQERPAAAGARADAVALSRWLRPTTLKQQFILTELFQPPLALRDPERRI